MALTIIAPKQIKATKDILWTLEGNFWSIIKVSCANLEIKRLGGSISNK